MKKRSNSSAGAATPTAHSKSMSAITINEDDAASFRHSSPASSGRNSPSNGGGFNSLGGIRFSKTGKMRRCLSMPETLFDVKSIMRFRTLDESLHSTYGSENGSKNGSNDKNNIKMGNVIIREYGRTVGDNPSCSSGPPVS